MGTFEVLPQTGLAGIVASSAASAWGFGSWVEIIQTTGALSVLSVSFQMTAIPAVDVTESIIMEVATGAAGAESTKLQIPFNFRQDTAVGYYLTQTHLQFLPEPYTVASGSRLAVRFADSDVAARTYEAVRIFVDTVTPLDPQNYGDMINQSVQRAAVW